MTIRIALTELREIANKLMGEKDKIKRYNPEKSEIEIEYDLGVRDGLEQAMVLIEKRMEELKSKQK